MLKIVAVSKRNLLIGFIPFGVFDLMGIILFFIISCLEISHLTLPICFFIDLKFLRSNLVKEKNFIVWERTNLN